MENGDLAVHAVETAERLIPWPRGTHPEKRRMFALLVEAGARGFDRQATAERLFRRSPRVVSRIVREEGLPIPSRCMELGRILAAMKAYRAGDRSRWEVATQTGLYADGNSMSNAVIRVTGFRPGDLPSDEELVESWLRSAAWDPGNGRMA